MKNRVWQELFGESLLLVERPLSDYAMDQDSV